MVTNIITFTSGESSECQVYINANGDVFIQDTEVDCNFLVIKAEDWPEVKKFIDRNLKQQNG